MGRAMMQFRFTDEEEKERKEKEELLLKSLFEIKSALTLELGPDVVNKHWPGYQYACQKFLDEMGMDVYEKLATPDFFVKWAKELNPKDLCALCFDKKCSNILGPEDYRGGHKQ